MSTLDLPYRRDRKPSLGTMLGLAAVAAAADGFGGAETFKHPDPHWKPHSEVSKMSKEDQDAYYKGMDEREQERIEELKRQRALRELANLANSEKAHEQRLWNLNVENRAKQREAQKAAKKQQRAAVKAHGAPPA